MSICGLGRGAAAVSGDGMRAEALMGGCAGCAVNGGSDECSDGYIRVWLEGKKEHAVTHKTEK